jgi:hypothetical protein
MHIKSAYITKRNLETISWGGAEKNLKHTYEKWYVLAEMF